MRTCLSVRRATGAVAKTYILIRSDVPSTLLRYGVVDTMREHARLLGEFFGEPQGMRQIRKFTGWYLKGFPGTKRLLPALHLVSTLAELDALLAPLPRDVPYPEVALRARRCKDGSTQTVSLPEGFLTARDEDVEVEDPAEMDGG